MSKELVIYEGCEDDKTWPSSNPVEFHCWLGEQLKKIPEEYRHKAIIEWSDCVLYECVHYTKMKIYVNL